MKKNSTYMTRALQASDRRYAVVLGKLGHTAPLLPTIGKRDPLDHDGNGVKGGIPKPDHSDELSALRSEYQEKVGKRPFHGWDAETLKAKIADAG